MSLQVKYSGVLALAQELKIKDLKVAEDGGALKLSGHQYHIRKKYGMG